MSKILSLIVDLTLAELALELGRTRADEGEELGALGGNFMCHSLYCRLKCIYFTEFDMAVLRSYPGKPPHY